MSSASESDRSNGRSVLDYLESWYHVPVLLGVVGVMLRIRLMSYGNFVRANEVLFSGNDAWYHLRQVNYTVRNWPFTMPYDPWTYFPYGIHAGQFGTLYDQLVATAALVLGLGDPSQQLVAKTLLVAPAVFGALTAVPVYYVGTRLGNRLSGLFGALVLMLLPGTFLSRTLVGVADHNAVEPFFQTAAVAAFLVALTIAEREKPVWELVVDRDWEALRPSIMWSAIAGATASIYMWVWPPGVLLLGVVAVFLVVRISSDTYRGGTPEPVAFVGAVSMGVTTLLMAVQIDEMGFSTTGFTLLQPFFALLIGTGSVFLAWLAREWESREIPESYYPYTILGLLVLSLLSVRLVLPDLFNTIQDNFYNILAFSASTEFRTIGEAQPFLQIYGLPPIDTIMLQYGFTFFTGVAAATWMLAKPFLRDGDRRDYGFVFGSLAIIAIIFLVPAIHTAIANAIGINNQVFALFVVAAIIAIAAHLGEHDAKNLFVISWAVFITSAAFTQVRFNYYLAVVVAVMNAYLFAEVISYLDLRTSLANFTEEVEAYQVIAVVMVALIVLMPVLVVPVQLSGASTNTAWQSAKGAGPGDITKWDETLDWMSENTPKEGNYANAGNADKLDYYGTYEKTDDFDYPKGAYGVMSWWDYGHWITVEGERIPNANPFQAGASTAANYLLAPNASQAQQVLDEQGDADEPTRYVMVDWQMASINAKFTAPVVFYNAGNISRGDFYKPIYYTSDQGVRHAFSVHKQRYYQSQMIRLYMAHGSAMSPTAPNGKTIVTDWETQTFQTRGGGTVQAPVVGKDGTIRLFNNRSAAEQFVKEDGSSQIGGIGPFPEERVPALQHYRLAKVSNASALDSPRYRRGLLDLIRHTRLGVNNARLLTGKSTAWVKTFERVPGATIHGSDAPANTTVTATVEMRMKTTNQTFTYTQQAKTDAHGEFTMVLPYSTTDYAKYGTDKGYTNVNVRATGPYTLSTPPSVENQTIVQYGAKVDVGEGRVVGAVEEPKQVDLEKRTRNFSSQSSNSSTNNSSGSIDYESLRTGSDPAENEDPDAALDLTPTIEATDSTEAES